MGRRPSSRQTGVLLASSSRSLLDDRSKPVFWHGRAHAFSHGLTGSTRSYAMPAGRKTCQPESTRITVPCCGIAACARNLGENAVGVGNLVRLARDSWQRLSDWNVSIRDVARTALSSDHKAFSAAAGRYLGLLERESWIDDAGLARSRGQINCERSHCGWRALHVRGIRSGKTLGNADQGAAC